MQIEEVNAMASEWGSDNDEWTPLPSRRERLMDHVGLWGGFAIAIIAYFVMLVVMS